MFGFLLVGTVSFLPPPDGYTDLIEISAAAFDEIFPLAEDYLSPSLDNSIAEIELFATTLDEIT